MCQDKKTSFEETTKNHQDQNTYYTVNTKTRNLEESYVITRVRKLGKTNISFFKSVCLSVRFEQLGSHWTDSHEL